MDEKRLREIRERLAALPGGTMERWVGHAVVMRGPLAVNTERSTRAAPGHPHAGQQLFEVDEYAFVEAPGEDEALDMAEAVAEFCARAPADVAELLAAVEAQADTSARAAKAGLLIASCMEHLQGHHGNLDPERLALVLAALKSALALLPKEAL